MRHATGAAIKSKRDEREALEKYCYGKEEVMGNRCPAKIQKRHSKTAIMEFFVSKTADQQSAKFQNNYSSTFERLLRVSTTKKQDSFSRNFW